MPQPREDGLWLTVSTNKSSSRIQGWRKKAARPSPEPGRKAARMSGQRMQGTPSRCGTWGTTCHTVPISTAEHGLWCPCQPILQGNGGVHSLSSSPFHSSSSPSTRRDSSAPRPPAALPGCQDSCLVCRTGLLCLEHDQPGREIVSRGEWGTPARTGRCPGVGFVLLGWHSPSLRSAPSGSVCARIHSDGRDRWGRTAQLCHGSADGAPWPLTCCPASACGPSSWLLASASCGATLELPAQGTHSARHGVSVPLAQATVWLEHPLMAANLPLGWGQHCQGAKALLLEWPLL